MEFIYCKRCDSYIEKNDFYRYYKVESRTLGPQRTKNNQYCDDCVTKMFECFEYNDIIIDYWDIYKFENLKNKECGKEKNDINNKIRENVIGSIINSKVPTKYFRYSRRWKKLKESILKYVEEISGIKNPYKMECIHKGGRKFNYDFIFIINELRFNVEFKYNAKSVSSAPQFVSPMKPSQYLSSSYEEFYYDNYIDELFECARCDIPDKETYLKQVHSTNPKCVNELKRKYKSVDKIYSKANELCKSSINIFISKNELNIEKLTEYLISTQQKKNYMLYTNDRFINKSIDMDDYILTSYTKEPNKYRFVATTKTNKKIKILLRWKNGNGIAFPAFQISC